MNTKLLIGIGVVVVVLVYLFAPRVNDLGGYLTSSVTVTSSTIVSNGLATSTATTSIYAAGANLQRLHIVNTGATPVWCAFGTNALVGEGLRVFGSSTYSQETEITDPNLLGKPMNCVAVATTTFSIFKY